MQITAANMYLGVLERSVATKRGSWKYPGSRTYMNSIRTRRS
jgi:hypothetical protein